MQPELASFISELRTYQMSKFKEIDRSTEGCFRIPYSGFLSEDYVTVEEYVEDRVNSLLLEAINHFQPETFAELQTILDELDEEDWIFPQVERDFIWQGRARESVIILEKYKDLREKDSTLWESMKDPQEALQTQAYFTYHHVLRQRLYQKMAQAVEKMQADVLYHYKHCR